MRRDGTATSTGSPLVYLAPPRRRSRGVALIAAVAVVAASCGDDGSNNADASGTVGAGSYPVTVESCGEPTRYDAAPARAVANDVNMVEMMLSLGLADRLAGVSGVEDRMDILPELQDDFDALPVLSSTYIELEPLLGADPDFFFAGWNYGLSEANDMTPERLGEYDISTYAINESCAHRNPDKGATNIGETFDDLRNVAKIFGVAERAEELIAEQQQVLDEVEDRLNDAGATTVFVYDSGEDAPYTAPGLAIPNDIIERAGGENIFADLQETWTTVSWEQVIDANPECVLIVDYGEVTWEQKRDFMLSNMALSEIPAVKNGCFLALPYTAMTPGVRNVPSVVEVADLLHPES